MISRIIMGFMILHLMGCADRHTPLPKPSAPAELSPASSITKPLSTAVGIHLKVWLEIHAAINLYGLKRHSARALSIGAMRSLQILEPNLRWRLTTPQISSHIFETEILNQPAPDPNNAQEWRDFVLRSIDGGRALSSALRITAPERMESLIFTGLISNLDTYSRYTGPSSQRTAQQPAQIGVELHDEPSSSLPIISAIAQGSPAAAAGLQVGMSLIAIDDEPLQGLSKPDILAKLSGEAGTVVELLLQLHGDDPHSEGHTHHIYQLKRAHPDTGSIHLLEAPTRTAWPIIRLQYFESATGPALRIALSQLTKRVWRQRHHGVIMDLRGNPGGVLHSAIDTADMFMSEGIISRTIGRHPDSFQTHHAAPNSDRGQTLYESQSVALILLVDEKTASSAEIFAAALRDSGRAIILGHRTQGKGTSQLSLPLSNGATLDLTWATLVAPAGYHFDGIGLAPTLCAPSEYASGNMPMTANDIRNAIERRWADIEFATHRIEAIQDCGQPYGPNQSLFQLADILLSHPDIYAEAISLQHRLVRLARTRERQLQEQQLQERQTP